MTKRLTAVLTLLLLIPMPLLPSATATAASLVLLPTALPVGHDAMASAWTGQYVYLLGGEYPMTQDIVRFDPSTETFTTMPTTLPTKLSNMGSGWDGHAIYLFGGADPGAIRDTIYRYDPSLGTVTLMNSHFPTYRYSPGVAWDGNEFVIIGGMGPSDEIYHYVPANDTLVLAAHMPNARGALSAVWDGHYVFAFGGLGASQNFDTIIRYDPATHEVVTMAARLPAPMRYSAAVWDGQRALLFMGGGSTTSDQVMVYDTAADQLTALDAPRFPVAGMAASAEWTGSAAYVFGGQTDVLGSNKTFRFIPESLTTDPQPTQPANFALSARPGNVTLSWQSPADDRGSTVTEYRIYAAENGAPMQLLESLAATNRSFTHEGLAVGRHMHYEILAVTATGVGERATGNIVSMKPRGPPATLVQVPVLLPQSEYGMASVWTGQYIYLFGGDYPSSNKIQRFDPVTETLVTMPSVLPVSGGQGGAGWDGQHAFLFAPDGGAQNMIIRYTPANGSIDIMNAHWPSSHGYNTAVWTGSRFLIFGSYLTDEIWIYDPVNDSLAQSTQHLPTARYDSASAWTGRYAYVFGGLGGPERNDILRYDPQTDTLVTMAATLPIPLRSSTATWDGNYIDLFMGTGSQSLDKVMRYDPAADTMTTLSTPTFPTYGYGATSQWVGATAYVFGGDSGYGMSNRIYRFDPVAVSSAPVAFHATSSTAGITLDWQPPADDGGLSATGYRLYVANGTSPLAPLAELAASDLSFVHDGLAPGSAHHYELAAITAAGEGARAIVDARVLLTPSAPRSLTATNTGPGQVTLGFSAPLDDGGSSLTGYTLYRHVGDSPIQNLTFLACGTCTSVVDAEAPHGVMVTYKLSASNAVGEGNLSDAASVVVSTTATAPLDVTATPGPDPGDITLTWSAPSDDGGQPVTGYVIDAADAGGTFARVASTTSTTWLESGLPEGHARQYVIRATNALGEGTPAPGGPATTFRRPDAVVDLRSDGTRNAIELSWSEPGAGGTPITAYRVYSSGTLVVELPASATGFRDAPLAGNTTRSYDVSAVNAVGEGPRAATTATAYATPTEPIHLSAVAGPLPGQITLAWDPPVDDGGQLILHYAIDAGDTESTLARVASTAALSWVESDLGEGQTRHYVVRAANALGEGDASAGATATTFRRPDPLPALTSVGSRNAIGLSWSEPSDGGMPITAYRVYVGGSLLAEVSATTLSYDDAPLAGNTTRMYVVAAVNEIGEGAGTGTTATAYDLPSATTITNTTPGPGAITLAWQAADGNGTIVTSYVVSAGAGSTGPFSALATVSGSTLTYAERGLGRNTTRWYTVTAVNAAGAGAASPPASGRSLAGPTEPQNLSTQTTTVPGQVSLLWAAPADDGGSPVTGYVVERADGPNGPYVTIARPTTKFYNDTVPDALPRWYQVRATNAAGDGKPSANVTGIPFPNASTIAPDLHKECQGITTTPVCTPGSTSAVTAIAAGGQHSCVLLANGNVDCWGSNTMQQSSDRQQRDAIALAAGSEHTCALLASHNVECWGSNAQGVTMPYQGGNAVGVAAGAGTTCILFDSGDAACRGQPLSYTGHDAVAVAAGARHACVLTQASAVTCMGDNSSGQLVRASGVAQVATGDAHTCIRYLDGTAKCFGSNANGQANAITRPTMDIAAGVAQTCYIDNVGDVRCMGRGWTSAPAYAGHDAVKVSVGDTGVLVLRADGTVQGLLHTNSFNDHGQGASYPR